MTTFAVLAMTFNILFYDPDGVLHATDCDRTAPLNDCIGSETPLGHQGKVIWDRVVTINDQCTNTDCCIAVATVVCSDILLTPWAPMQPREVTDKKIMDFAACLQRVRDQCLTRKRGEDR